jgi:FMN phosphatase YigB (HAD superfamily)
MTRKHPKVLLIDWFKTLSYSKFWGHLEIHNNERFKLIENFLFSPQNNLARSWMTGKFASENVIKIISNKLRIPYKKLFKDFTDSCRSMEFSDKDIPDIVRELREQGNKVYIFSDNMDSLDRWTSPALQLNKLFNGIINSFNVGYLKNDVDKSGKSFFIKEMLKKEKFKNKDLLLFDDHVSTIKLFKTFGIKGIAVTERNNLKKALERII